MTPSEDDGCPSELSCRIVNLVITGPTGIGRKKVSTDEYTISWTPTQNELNGHFAICFIAETLIRWGVNKSRDLIMGELCKNLFFHVCVSSRVYQSNVRCVVAAVGSHGWWNSVNFHVDPT